MWEYFWMGLMFGLGLAAAGLVCAAIFWGCVGFLHLVAICREKATDWLRDRRFQKRQVGKI